MFPNSSSTWQRTDVCVYWNKSRQHNTNVISEELLKDAYEFCELFTILSLAVLVARLSGHLGFRTTRRHDICLVLHYTNTFHTSGSEECIAQFDSAHRCVTFQIMRTMAAGEGASSVYAVIGGGIAGVSCAEEVRSYLLLPYINTTLAL